VRPGGLTNGAVSASPFKVGDSAFFVIYFKSYDNGLLSLLSDVT
jgi:hypothetical protein